MFALARTAVAAYTMPWCLMFTFGAWIALLYARTITSGRQKIRENRTEVKADG